MLMKHVLLVKMSAVNRKTTFDSNRKIKKKSEGKCYDGVKQDISYMFGFTIFFNKINDANSRNMFFYEIVHLTITVKVTRYFISSVKSCYIKGNNCEAFFGYLYNNQQL